MSLIFISVFPVANEMLLSLSVIVFCQCVFCLLICLLVPDWCPHRSHFAGCLACVCVVTWVFHWQDLPVSSFHYTPYVLFFYFFSAAFAQVRLSLFFPTVAWLLTPGACLYFCFFLIWIWTMNWCNTFWSRYLSLFLLSYHGYIWNYPTV